MPKTTEEAFFQRRLAQLPALDKKAGTLALPAAAPPSLEDLLVTAPGPAPITPEELMAYAELRVRERAPRVPRKRGEEIQLGDEAMIDVLGYANGALIPFSARGQVKVDIGFDDTLPWLDQALVGAVVGDALELQVSLPEDYPVESLRNVEATFLIDVLSASEVKEPDVDSPAFLELLGPAQNVDAALELAAHALEEERVQDAWDEAREMVLDEVVRRTELAVPPQAVDAEIKAAWQRIEAPYLLAKEFDEGEQKEALAAWLADEPTRIDADRRLRLAVALQAVAAQHSLSVDDEALRLVAELGQSRFDVKPEQLLADPTNPELRRVALHLRALQFVLGKASVRFEGVEGVHPLVPRS